MRRSTFLLCAAAIGLAACGSDDAENLANQGADVANAANTAGADASEAAGEAANAAGGAADAAGEASSNAAGTAVGKGNGGTITRIPGKQGKRPIIVAFQGCPRIVNVSKPGGCLVVQSGSQTYEIDSARPRPAPGQLIITGSGVYNPNVRSICMAGKHLTKVTWRPTKAKCSSVRRG